MKFGVRLHPFGTYPNVPAMVETVQRMEQLGYDFIYLPEHTIFPVEHERKMGRTFYETVGPDGQVKRTDGYRATWEHYKGKPLVYPKPQYYEPVVMFPEQFPWESVEGMPDNQVKPLGSFSGGDVELAMVRAEPGASFTQGSASRRQILFVTEGEMEGASDVDTPSLGKRSAVYTEAGETAQYRVTAEMTALVITLPTFAS